MDFVNAFRKGKQMYLKGVLGMKGVNVVGSDIDAYAMGPLCYRMRSQAQSRAQKYDNYGEEARRVMRYGPSLVRVSETRKRMSK